jgi:putative hydrolase of the HAD superfamily
MQPLLNIIFDLGGVLMNIDYNLTANAFIELGVNDFKKMYGQYSADELFESLETGHTNEDLFYAFMTTTGMKALSKPQVQLAWNAMLLDFRLESFEFIKTLSTKYNLYLLSNTNAIHKAAFDEAFTLQTGLPSIDNYFKKSYYSHLIGLRKPHENCFKYVLEDEGMIPENTLFIDDSVNNIEAAAKLGIKTHLLLPGEKIEDLDYNSYFTSS